MSNSKSKGKGVDWNARDINSILVTRPMSDDPPDEFHDDYNERYSQPIDDDDAMRAYNSKIGPVADIEQEGRAKRETYIPGAIGGSSMKATMAPMIFDTSNGGLAESKDKDGAEGKDKDDVAALSMELILRIVETLHLMYITTDRCHKDVSAKSVGYARSKSWVKRTDGFMPVLTDFDMFDPDIKEKETPEDIIAREKAALFKRIEEESSRTEAGNPGSASMQVDEPVEHEKEESATVTES